MRKILQISIEVNSGSVGRIAEQIGQKAIEHGWESYITYARNNLPSKSNIIKIGTLVDVYFHGIMTRLTDKHAFYSTHATEKLIERIKEINPDIILLHHLHGYFINVEILFNYLSKIKTPIIWVFHDCWSFTGHCAYFDFVGCNKWINGCYECPQKTEYPGSYLIDRSKKNYLQKKELFNSIENLTIVPVSFWLGGLVRKSFLKNHSIKVIQNGIDLGQFKPSDSIEEVKRKYNIKNEFIILGVASTWDDRKGLKEFIKLNDYLINNEKIILVGLSKKQLNEIPSSIIGIERTENVQQLADLYSLADVFINPTFEDTYPTTNLESMACGTPVITYKTGGSVEAISDDTGIIVEKGDIDGLHKAIKVIQSNGKELYKKNCRIRAEKNFDKSICFEKYFLLFDELLKVSSINL